MKNPLLQQVKYSLMWRMKDGPHAILNIWLTKELLKDIDKIASLTGRNRNEILTMSLEFALNHMEVILKEQEEE